jgi:hypothetical protein
MARYPKHPKPARRRGRRELDLDPWLEKMHLHVLEGMSDHRAAQLVVYRYGQEIPQGTNRVRSGQSTVDLLRRRYPRWLTRQTELKKAAPIDLALGVEELRATQGSLAQTFGSAKSHELAELLFGRMDDPAREIELRMKELDEQMQQMLSRHFPGEDLRRRFEEFINSKKVWI